MENIMGDFKSKLPDLKELGEISGKLFKDLKTSVSEIITTYQQKRPKGGETKASDPAKNKPVKKTTAKEKKEDKS
jgi:hypothetical protein